MFLARFTMLVMIPNFCLGAADIIEFVLGAVKKPTDNPIKHSMVIIIQILIVLERNIAISPREIAIPKIPALERYFASILFDNLPAIGPLTTISRRKLIII